MVQKKSFSVIALTAITMILAIIYLAPVIWTLFVSFQVEGKLIDTVWAWFTPLYTIRNYLDVIFYSSVPRWFLNSLGIAVVATTLTIFVSSMAAYAIAKIDFKGKSIIFFYFMLGIMVPGEATIVPLFITANGLNLIDSYAGIILPGLAGTINLMILVTAMRGIPNEVIEAVRIDGGNEFTIYSRLIIPLSTSVLSTVIIFAFIGSWNNYLWPLLCALDPDIFTLPVGIPTFASTYSVDYVRPMTANMVASLPMIVLYLIFEKRIVKGISTSGLKG